MNKNLEILDHSIAFLEDDLAAMLGELVSDLVGGQDGHALLYELHQRAGKVALLKRSRNNIQKLLKKYPELIEGSG